jgi:hypothetical protein
VLQTSVALALVPPDAQKLSPRPAGGSHRLGYHLGRAGEWQGPSRKDQFRVLGSPSALRASIPRKGGPPGGRGSADPIFSDRILFAHLAETPFGFLPTTFLPRHTQ